MEVVLTVILIVTSIVRFVCSNTLQGNNVCTANVPYQGQRTKLQFVTRTELHLMSTWGCGFFLTSACYGPRQITYSIPVYQTYTAWKVKVFCCDGFNASTMSTCDPVCQEGCSPNGHCIAPGKCDCKDGYENYPACTRPRQESPTETSMDVSPVVKPAPPVMNCTRWCQDKCNVNNGTSCQDKHEQGIITNKICPPTSTCYEECFAVCLTTLKTDIAQSMHGEASGVPWNLVVICLAVVVVVAILVVTITLFVRRRRRKKKISDEIPPNDVELVDNPHTTQEENIMYGKVDLPNCDIYRDSSVDVENPYYGQLDLPGYTTVELSHCDNQDNNMYGKLDLREGLNQIVSHNNEEDIVSGRLDAEADTTQKTSTNVYEEDALDTQVGRMQSIPHNKGEEIPEYANVAANQI